MVRRSERKGWEEGRATQKRRDKESKEGTPSVLCGRTKGVSLICTLLNPVPGSCENSSCDQSFSGSFKMHEMGFSSERSFPAQEIRVGLNEWRGRAPGGTCLWKSLWGKCLQASGALGLNYRPGSPRQSWARRAATQASPRTCHHAQRDKRRS